MPFPRSSPIRRTSLLRAALAAALLFRAATTFAAPAEPLADLLDAGRIADAAARLDELGPKRADRALRLRLLVARQDFALAAPGMSALLKTRRPDASERTAIYAWLVARDDLAEIDRRTRGASASAASDTVDLLAAGQLALSLHDTDRAAACDRLALERAKRPAERADALRALGEVDDARRDVDASLKHLQASLATFPTATAEDALADTLVRLARAAEASDASEDALRMNPFDARAHYLLGNGYARRNYTELQRDAPDAVSRAAVLVRQGSDAFEQGDFAASRRFAVEALQACPQYGRAHNLLAKALEQQRLAIDVHHADYERRFARTPMPVIADIERFVLNWNELSPRHRKRVALSIAPWKAFVPVLVAGGETLYIKPLYMRLSETPGLEEMKDQRIDYDSRLWDDVRGAGGSHTVTGIEDVEALISDRYNTVLHELSHQVHGVLGADDWRAIEALYRQAKARDAASADGFLSRYAGGSIWEYFAEGANSEMTPRRDAWDTREIVRERLARIDPDLQALERRLFARRDVAASLPIALVNGAQEALGKGRTDEAVALVDRALVVAPDDELVLAAAVSVHAVHGDRAQAAALSERALRRYPDSARLRIAAAEARWMGGESLEKVVADLGAGLERLATDDRAKVEQAIGDYARQRGDVDAALRAYDAVLAAQADAPEGLAGKAATLALAGRWDDAFALYARAVRLRTGEVDLRLQYARDLMLAGRLADARVQLAAAQTLDATSPDYLALEAWAALLGHDAEASTRLSTQALAVAPWCDMALAAQAAALRSTGEADRAAALLAPLQARLAGHAAPEYARRADKPEPVLAHALSAAERRVIDQLARLPPAR